jgi:hypothetical protein
MIVMNESEVERSKYLEIPLRSLLDVRIGGEKPISNFYPLT